MSMSATQGDAAEIRRRHGAEVLREVPGRGPGQRRPDDDGRILAMVPDVSSLLPTSWCMPCVPAAGLQAGMLAVPSIGAGVWVEFEQGDPDYPIWSGCLLGQRGRAAGAGPTCHRPGCPR